MGFHKDQTANHPIHNWEPADAAALAAIVPEDIDDNGKVAWQQDDDSLHILVDWTGPTWEDFSGSGGGDVTGPAGATDNAITRYDGATGKTLQNSIPTISDIGDLNMLDGEVIRPELNDYSVTHNSQAGVSGATDVDCEDGNSHDLILTGNITSMTFSNPPASGRKGSLVVIIEQGGTGSYTIAWPASVDWPGGGVVPTPSTAVGSIDIYAFLTIDGGTIWFGVQAGADFG